MTKSKKRQIEALRTQLERRMAMAMSAHDFIEQIVPVQPMPFPTAQVMYLDIVVGPHSAQVRNLEEFIR